MTRRNEIHSLKKIILLYLLFIIYCSIITSVLAADDIQNINSLMIFICNKEYEGERFLNDGLLYVSLNEFALVLGIKGKGKNENNKIVVEMIEGVKKTIKIKYKILFKNNNYYVPLITFCQVLDYKISYDKTTNILDIGTSVVYTGKTNTYLNEVGSNYLSNSLIEPGKNIGIIFLGYTIETVINLLEEANNKEIYDPHNGRIKKVEKIDLTTDISGKKVTLDYNNSGFSIDFDGDTRKAVTIRTTNENYMTAKGMKVGSSLDEVMNIYPHGRLHTDPGIYYLDELGFSYDSSTRKVKLVVVFDESHLHKKHK